MTIDIKTGLEALKQLFLENGDRTATCISRLQSVKNKKAEAALLGSFLTEILKNEEILSDIKTNYGLVLEHTQALDTADKRLQALLILATQTMFNKNCKQEVGNIFETAEAKKQVLSLCSAESYKAPNQEIEKTNLCVFGSNFELMTAGLSFALEQTVKGEGRIFTIITGSRKIKGYNEDITAVNEIITASEKNPLFLEKIQQVKSLLVNNTNILNETLEKELALLILRKKIFDYRTGVEGCNFKQGDKIQVVNSTINQETFNQNGRATTEDNRTVIFDIISNKLSGNNEVVFQVGIGQNKEELEKI